MNNRLLCIASHIPFGKGVIDVGTDHGYLPIELLRRGYPGSVFASDIKEGPLRAAVHSARAAGLEGRISFRLCDGLDKCEPDSIDTIVIAGMGGDTICGILDRAEWCMDSCYTLVLQPMTHAEVLRYWLIHNEFFIEEEDIVKDAGNLYSVLVVRFGGSDRLNEAELFTGACSMLRQHRLFQDLVRQETTRFRRVLRGLEEAADREASGRYAVLRTVLTQLEEMSSYDDT